MKIWLTFLGIPWTKISVDHFLKPISPFGMTASITRVFSVFFWGGGGRGR